MGLLAVGIWAQDIASAVSNKNASFGERIKNVFELVTNEEGTYEGPRRFTLLLAGRDYNHNSKSIKYTSNSRADTIMLLQVDVDKKTVTGISIPRDTKVTAPDGITGKINATLGRGGIDLLAESVQSLTGIKADHTVVLKADAVKNIVDAVGGVEVETIDEMHYDDYWGGLHVHLPKGRQRLNGEQAVGFTRFREVNTKKRLDNGRFVSIKVVHSKEEGDARRMARQQQLIRALADSAKSPSNVMQMGGIIQTAFSQVDTTLTKEQLAGLAKIFRGAQDNIKTATLLGGDENGEVYYFVPDVEKTKALVDWMFNDNEYAGRQLVRVAVYNGTKVKGAAKLTADKLEDLMYDAFSSGNSKEPAETSFVVYRTASVESRARDLAKALGINEVRKATEDDLKVEVLGSVEPDVRVTIGADLADLIVAAKNPESNTPRLGG